VEAITLAEKSVALAEHFEDERVLAMAYDTLGTTMLYLDYPRGGRILERCLEIASEAGLDARVATVYGNWGATACDLYRLDDAEKYLKKGIVYSAEHDMDLIRLHLLAWQAYTLLFLGRWSEVEGIANEVFQRPNITATNRIPALVVLSRLYARRGEPDPRDLLDEALVLATRTNAFQDLGQVRAVRAEAAWLAGDSQRTLLEARAGYDLAVSKKHPWIAGELAFWLRQAGVEETTPVWLAKPFALQLAGDWQAAANEWLRLGCPYEQARALVAGDQHAQVAALRIFDRLGAHPAAEMLRQKMQATGAASVPGKPRTSTRDNPFSLTDRQLQILTLLMDGLSNNQIADQLHISPKTTDHHVSAILAKLDARTRQEAAAIARQHPHFNK
jgi:DNA-binding CsgD family transcriptional regulator